MCSYLLRHCRQNLKPHTYFLNIYDPTNQLHKNHSLKEWSHSGVGALQKSVGGFGGEGRKRVLSRISKEKLTSAIPKHSCLFRKQSQVTLYHSYAKPVHTLNSSLDAPWTWLNSMREVLKIVTVTSHFNISYLSLSSRLLSYIFSNNHIMYLWATRMISFFILKRSRGSA